MPAAVAGAAMVGQRGSSSRSWAQKVVPCVAAERKGTGSAVNRTDSRPSAPTLRTRDAAHTGETTTRLDLIAAWRGATVFNEAERAALELTEQGTRIADAAGGVTDEAWANATKHHDKDQLTALVSLIALTNTFNRAAAELAVMRCGRELVSWPGPPGGAAWG